jgi:hypothetical protein
MTPCQLVYNSKLVLAFRCCSFLSDVVVNFICILLVFPQLVLLSNSSKNCFIPFVVKNCESRCFFVTNIISTDVTRFCPVLPEYTEPLVRWQKSSLFLGWEPQDWRKLGSFLHVLPQVLKTCYISIHQSTAHFHSSVEKVTVVYGNMAIKFNISIQYFSVLWLQIM